MLCRKVQENGADPTDQIVHQNWYSSFMAPQKPREFCPVLLTLPSATCHNTLLRAGCCINRVSCGKHDKNLSIESITSCRIHQSITVWPWSLAVSSRSIAALGIYLTWMLENTLLGWIPICYQLNGSIRFFFFFSERGSALDIFF